ncbi:MAG: hypothetical protein COA36_16225 [Desulfotalea sp.]|nr:MAG: hypothetical protein COA36_16225 [Desulfotalea sp.]
MQDITVLFVDDESRVLKALERNLIKEPYQKRYVDSGAKALEIMNSESVHVIVSDMKMPEMDGLALLQLVKTKYPDTVRLVLSGFIHVGQIIPAINTGEIYRYITKPLEPGEFRKTVRDAIDYYLLNLDRRELLEKLKRRNSSLNKALIEQKKAEFALGKANTKAREVESRIEADLLRGQVPEQLTGVTIAVLGESAEHLGGDFYEIIDLHPDCFDLMVGDVMGKGVDAALVGAGTKQHFLRALCRGAGGEVQSIVSPAELAQNVHAAIAGRLIQLDYFATVVYARFDLDKRLLTCVDCGHPPILHYKAESGICSFLKGDNSPIGFTENEQFVERSYLFQKNDLIILYSDGITEALSPQGEMFGLDGFVKFVETNSFIEPVLLVEKLRNTIADFTTREKLQDDFTCAVVKIG